MGRWKLLLLGRMLWLKLPPLRLSTLATSPSPGEALFCHSLSCHSLILHLCCMSPSSTNGAELTLCRNIDWEVQHMHLSRSRKTDVNVLCSRSDAQLLCVVIFVVIRSQLKGSLSSYS